MAPALDPPAVDHGGRRFDNQAPVFDDRTGLPPEAAAAVAGAVLGFDGRVGRPEVVLEVGAGTGELGRHLVGRVDRYVGIDTSRPMLEVFASKLAPSAAGDRVPLLVRADADAPWPVATGRVPVVFASRVAHLLSGDHLVAEVSRVSRRPGCFVVGRVERDGIKKSLRQRREALLVERGIAAGRSGLRRTRAVLDAFVAEGAIAQPRRTVASWTAFTTAEEVIAAWETMSTMAGQPVAPDSKAEILTELRRWADREFGGLDRQHSYGEHYTLEGVLLT